MTIPDSSLSADQRADELLAQMTVEEKALQLSAVMAAPLLGPGGPVPEALDGLLRHGIGHISAIGTFGHKQPVELATAVNSLQRYLVENTRLGIPAIFHNESLNGLVAPGFSAFPTAIGLAATWRPDQVQEMTRLIARQLRSVGITQSLSPVMDVARDARWGRVHETFGEDPYLGSAMSVAYVRGLQGDDLAHGVIATAKHFLGYGMTEAGQNMAATQISERELVEVYARPFEAAIKLAGLRSVMNSYSEYDGVPVGASARVLRGLLREQLGFEGAVVSDYSAVEFLCSRQLVASSAEEAGAQALAAGIDVELPSIFGYGPVLADAVTKGLVPRGLLDEAVRRVLRDKFALGLFERPYANDDPIVIRAQAKSGSELSLELAAASVTLLKNTDDALPLPGDLRRIAIVGPHADDVTIGFPAYTYPAALGLMKALTGGGDGAMAGTEALLGLLPHATLAALTAELAPVHAQGDDAYIRDSYHAGSLADAVRELRPDAIVDVAEGTGVLAAEPQDIAAAVAIAREADAVVLALGGRGGWFASTVTEGEGEDASDIDLPAQQLELARAVVATGTPTVAVISVGRPYGLTELESLVPGILLGYYGGPGHGRALAAALLGDSNPGGKLPYTLPRRTGQVPIYAAQRNGSGYRRTDRDLHKTGYIDGPATPLYALGHGLSYTTFEYSDLTASEQSVPADGVLELSVVLTNTGPRTGDEVVQFYIHDTAANITRPALQLAGFARATLEAGESAQVAARIPLSLVGYVGLPGNLVMEPGPITVYVGSASDDLRLSADIEVSGETTELRPDREFLSDVTVRRGFGHVARVEAAEPAF